MHPVAPSTITRGKALLSASVITGSPHKRCGTEPDPDPVRRRPRTILGPRVRVLSCPSAPYAILPVERVAVTVDTSDNVRRHSRRHVRGGYCVANLIGHTFG